MLSLLCHHPSRDTRYIQATFVRYRVRHHRLNHTRISKSPLVSAPVCDHRDVVEIVSMSSFPEKPLSSWGAPFVFCPFSNIARTARQPLPADLPLAVAAMRPLAEHAGGPSSPSCRL